MSFTQRMIRRIMSDVRIHRVPLGKLTIVHADNPTTYENAPISIQVIGCTMEEEAVIAMSEIVDEALGVAKAKSAKQ
jgi:Asp-tRNA(Asn)/Glu-tRNA(Gln) amidotransferase A subunit family amidase